MGYMYLLRSGVVPDLLKSSRLCLGNASGVLENVPGARARSASWSHGSPGHCTLREQAADLPL